MTPDDLRRIKKILMLAAHNDNDHQAIAAFRQATKMLAKNNVTWEQLIDFGVIVQQPVSVDSRHRYDDEDGSLIERALRNVRPGSFRDVLLSIQEQFERKGRLTPRQWSVVRKASESG